MLTQKVESIDLFLHTYFYLSRSWSMLIFKPWTLITYFFMPHGYGYHIMHTLYELVIFYFFGRIITYFLGNRKLVNLYFLSGIMGGMTFLLVCNTTPYFRNVEIMPIHLPVAVYGVVTAAAAFAPDFAFQFFFTRIQIKYIAYALLFMPFIHLASGYAYSVAQLGSAWTGYLYIQFLKNFKGWQISRDKMRTMTRQVKNTITGYRRKLVKNRALEQGSIPSEKDLQYILDKIAYSGFESLTKEEKSILIDSSKR